jgi:hypothetical protein
VVHIDPTLGQELFDVAVREPEPQVPAEGEHNDLGREPETPER